MQRVQEVMQIRFLRLGFGYQINMADGTGLARIILA